MIKLKEGVYIDRKDMEIVYTENNEVTKRVPLPIEADTSGYTSEYGHYGENNGPVGESSFD